MIYKHCTQYIFYFSHYQHYKMSQWDNPKLFYSSSSRSVKMTKLLQKAEAELEKELQNDMKDGATSNRFSRKKVTVV